MKVIRFLFLGASVLFPTLLFSQYTGIHEQEWIEHQQLGFDEAHYDSINIALPKQRISRANCTLDKIVYGWHPYWSNGLQSNYDWSLLSHFCYFSYEFDPGTGNPTNTHSFSTTQSVTDALNNGVKVTLCVTLFSSHSTFLGNATARQNLITNLINIISARGAHGVNIDFEGIPSSQTANFTNFMNDLANQMHAAIPGSEVSTVLYAVDWNNVFDVVNMPNVDQFIIMGYDYYYNGSTTAGPNDPLFHFGTTYNYTLSKSVTYYLDKGVPASKLVLGLPYYGREWPVSSTGIPAAATASGSSKTYTTVRTNAGGNYTAANRYFDNASVTTYYQFNSSGWRQCFISEENDLRERLDFIRKRGIGGMGIWALGYDDGYNEFWNAINDYMTTCYVSPCSATLSDIGGGPQKNYYDNEEYTYTISPANASSVTLNFSAFSLEANFDYLYVYDGPNTASPQVSGSPFTGTVIPASITSSGGSLTLRFVSDGNTTAPGFVASYTCTTDNTPPVSSINLSNTWKTQNFNVGFTDSDVQSGVANAFWQVMDYDGTEWRANGAHGFINDNFTNTIHSEWTNQTGAWSINASRLRQSDEAQQNSNLWIDANQNSNFVYLYHWQANMQGTGTNRRSGIHFFCDNPSLSNRGNSYFVYFRVDSDKCQIYKVVNDVFTLMTDDDVALNPSTWYDYKITYDPVSGKIAAYVNNTKVSEWTDPSPLQTGNSISLRSAGTDVFFDDVKMYRSRSSAESVAIGNSATMVRFQNNGPTNPACKIRALCVDQVGLWSNSISQDVNIDWTTPNAVVSLQDGIGADTDNTSENAYLVVNWTNSTDPHSGIDHYETSVGLSPGDDSWQGWTNAGNGSSDTIHGLFLNYNQTYYVNLRAVNGAGLVSTEISTDGIFIDAPSATPVANFQGGSFDVCLGDSLTLMNLSQYATAFSWSIPAGFPNTSNDPTPSILFPGSGVYAVSLIAQGPGGNDTLQQNITISTVQPASASFTANDTLLFLPNAFVALNNTSQNALYYHWDFGNGLTSSDVSPWMQYDSLGTFFITLLAWNDACAADTLVQTVYVSGYAAIEESAETFRLLSISESQFLLKFPGQHRIQLFDVQGKMLFASSMSEEIMIDLSLYSSGLYVLMLDGEHVKKLMRP